jgi:predicted 3-demethylubiquinone-9 3-methyltransferase (glyoxalase superfamily)
MQKIFPFLWFDGQTEKAIHFYREAFKNVEVHSIKYWGEGTPFPKDQVMQSIFDINGLTFHAFDAGPQFRINPSVSFFIFSDSKEELENTWNKLSNGGKILMGFDTYPWSEKYGWCEDKFGVNWQLMLDTGLSGTVAPCLMFTQHNSGRAADAMKLYTSLFDNSEIKLVSKYEKGEPDVEGYIKHAQFTLNGQVFACMDSSAPHQFVFNEGISLFVNCDTQEEIDYLWDSLTANGGTESMCGWLKDRFGVSWQLIPRVLGEWLGDKNKAKAGRVMQAMMGMKKIIIADLEKAAKV